MSFLMTAIFFFALELIIVPISFKLSGFDITGKDNKRQYNKRSVVFEKIFRINSPLRTIVSILAFFGKGLKIPRGKVVFFGIRHKKTKKPV